MSRLVSISVMCIAMLSGCATTQTIVSKVTGSETPLSQVLNERPDLRKDLATVELRQYFNSVESPTVAEVKLTETGLMDDSTSVASNTSMTSRTKPSCSTDATA